MEYIYAGGVFMSSSYMKAGAEDFRKMRDDYKRNSDNIDQMVKFLDTSLNSSIWEGQAQARFHDAWTSTHKPNLLKLKQALQDMSAEMESRRNWTEQFENAGKR